MTDSVALSWSGGKDSMLALHELRHRQGLGLGALLTTLTREYDRVSMHGVRRRLLEQQARSLGVPLEQALIPAAASNADYEDVMDRAFSALRARGLGTVAFGDLFLEDIRQYRERMVERAGMRALFPLWLRDTRALAAEFVRLGFRAVVVCVDTTQLDAHFSGREYDAAFLRDLPPHVDPCGENGEFHTFVYDGPGFAEPIALTSGEVVVRDERFAFCDLLPGR